MTATAPATASSSSPSSADTSPSTPGTVAPPNDNSTVTTETVPKSDGSAVSPNSIDEKAPEAQRSTTTEVRKPLEVPSSVHIKIEPSNLVDYVGPAIYQRERIYTKLGPAGVSTGLGYLGDASGSGTLNFAWQES